MENASSMRVTQSGSVEVARKELNESKMRCYQVMDLLLTFGDSALVSRGKFLLDEEGIKMAGIQREYMTRQLWR